MDASEIEKEFVAAGSQAAAPRLTHGATICDTPEAIKRFRMITCLTGLSLEAKGIRPSRISCLAVARKFYGIKARTAEKAHRLLRAKMIEYGVIDG